MPPTHAPSFPCVCGCRCWHPGTPQQGASFACSCWCSADDASPRRRDCAAGPAGSAAAAAAAGRRSSRRGGDARRAVESCRSTDDAADADADAAGAAASRECSCRATVRCAWARRSALGSMAWAMPWPWILPAVLCGKKKMLRTTVHRSTIQFTWLRSRPAPVSMRPCRLNHGRDRTPHQHLLACLAAKRVTNNRAGSPTSSPERDGVGHPWVRVCVVPRAWCVCCCRPRSIHARQCSWMLRHQMIRSIDRTPCCLLC